jgi:hypothetical protein
MFVTTNPLAPLFWAITLATITFEDIPSELRAGSDYYIKWTQDRDYGSGNTLTYITINPDLNTTIAPRGLLPCAHNT